MFGPCIGHVIAEIKLALHSLQVLVAVLLYMGKWRRRLGEEWKEGVGRGVGGGGEERSGRRRGRGGGEEGYG